MTKKKQLQGDSVNGPPKMQYFDGERSTKMWKICAGNSILKKKIDKNLKEIISLDWNQTKCHVMQSNS